MTGGDIFIIVIVILGVIAAALYFLNKWAYTKMEEQQSAIQRTKQPATIFIIDKKKEKAENAGFPKMVTNQLPRYSKLFKMYVVKAKVGPQIVTLICDKDVFNALPVKKSVKVELAGIYITTMQGMKSKEEMKAIGKAKKEKAKEAAKKEKIKS